MTLFAPCIHLARDKIRRHPHYTLLADSAHADLEAYLSARLSDATAAVLDLKFAVFRARCLPFMAKDCQSSTNWLSSGEFAELSQEYPALVGLLKTLTDFWIESISEFLQRLADDWQSIELTFGIQNQQVNAVQTGLSDPHRRGRSVFIAHFDSSLKLVYKPRDLGIDAAFFDFLAWLNPQLALPFCVLKIMARAHYGWMEYVPESPPHGAAEIQRYAHRAGGLLAIIYLLDGTDFQHENLIMAGEQALLIDLETLLQPSVAEHRPFLGQQRFSDSVLRCGFLPQWNLGPQQQVYDLSAMSKTPNLDAEAFGAGFSEMYRLLMRLRAELLSADSPLTAFAEQTIRPIFQDTALYQRLLKQSLQTKYLQSERDRHTCLAFLNRLSNTKTMPRIEAEIASLEQLDIPYFTANSSEKTLFTPQPLADFFLEAPYTRLRANLKNLDEVDLARQLGYIRACCSFAGYKVLTHKPDRFFAGCQASVWKQTLLNNAQAIAEQLKNTALHTRYGGVTWAIPERTGQSEHYHLQPADAGIYNGISGICLFLAALDSVTGSDEHRDVIFRALKPVQDTLNDSQQRTALARQLDLGLAAGIGSLVYACTQLSRFLQAGELLDAARQAAALLTPERIGADRQWDVLAGAAGAILGLLALYNETKDDVVLQQSIECGQHLLAQELTEQTLSGFGHGAAGMAYALLRLFAVSGKQQWRDAAEKLIHFENSLFSAEANNWRTFASSTQQPAFWTSFCHGAAGIGLARLAGLPMLDTPQIRCDIDAALQTTQTYTMNHLDFLCCGHAGRLAFLAQAARQLQRPELHVVVRQKIAWILQRRQAHGDFLLFDEFSGVDNPSLFKGRAGIGYQFLRLAYPEQIPSLLSFDA